MDKIKQKIKNSLESNTTKDILISLIVILVGLSSFGLGRLSKENSNTGIIVEYPNQVQNLDSGNDTLKNTSDTNNSLSKTYVSPTNSLGKAYFASKIGKKYYSIGCSGGKSIKQENRIYFNTEAEAQAAGYEKSSTCK